MARILFVAVNASYSHTALSVRGLCEFVKAQNISGVFVDFREVTINQPFGDILRSIAVWNPDVVLFSTYIWNGELVSKIICDLKKILPGIVVGAGGPEFGFSASKYMAALANLDFVMKGEGELTVADVCNCVADYGVKGLLSRLKDIPGIFYRVDGGICYSGGRDLLCDLSVLPFPYPDLFVPEKLSVEMTNHKIYYYESSRGCPFSCSYCMSSIDRHVRFMPLERVFCDLQVFLDAGVGLVKFVDRTYNINPDRYIAIWDYILGHHNGKTMFHFEIEAEFLSEAAIEFLQNVPAGVMQFEIGVQSSNKKTLAAISRSTNIEKLADNVRRIPKTIHQHLDLIAGLPYEDLDSFGRSFDFVMSLKPDALQLGFLKVLSGTAMEKYALESGWKWMENPVYETFSTPYMSYGDMLFLKDLEVAVDAYWNSGVFSHFMGFLLRKVESIWAFFREFTLWGEKRGVFDDARRETFWFGEMAEYLRECKGEGEPEQADAGLTQVDAGLTQVDVHLTPGADLSQADVHLTRGAGVTQADGNLTMGAGLSQADSHLHLSSFNKSLLYDLLRYDFVLRGKQGNYPDWYNHIYNKDRHRELLQASGNLINPRLAFGHSEYEVFQWDVEAPEPEKCKGCYEKLIQYGK